jgi:predicted RNA-binding Zn ribbon-like protein
MSFSEAAASLVNAPMWDGEALRRAVADRPALQPRCTDRDATIVRRLQRELRPVFEASGAGDAAGVVRLLNQLLERHPLTPSIADDGPGRLHLHASAATGTVGDQLMAESLLGLSTLVCEWGPLRLGVCGAPECPRVYVDTSPNRSRRYCSERCSSRTNVAAYRARRRAALA